jgi:hypothetical protein
MVGGWFSECERQQCRVVVNLPSEVARGLCISMPEESRERQEANTRSLDMETSSIGIPAANCVLSI